MALSFGSFTVTVPGSGDAPIPSIMAASQPIDRRTEASGLTQSVVVALTSQQLASWSPLVTSWSVERSSDGGLNWTVVAAAITDSLQYVDHPAVGTHLYRSATRTALGKVSNYSNEVEIYAGAYGSYEDGAISEVESSSGAVSERLSKAQAYPTGLGEACIGTGACEGSLGGSFGAGSWYVAGREVTPPTMVSNVPACGSTAVTHPVTSITFTLRDLPYPTGGSGIVDASIRIWLSTTSQNSGLERLIWDGSSSPWTPDVSVSIVPGSDPILERDVTITLASGYLDPRDIVKYRIYVEDNDGNSAELICDFEVEDLDTIPPVVDQNSPICGLGTTATDLARAPRNTDLSFRVTDNGSLVNLSTLQVYYGTSSTGPWTQVLQNGSTFLGGFYGVVTPLTGIDKGYFVTIKRPVASPLWAADTEICVRVTVSDNQGNATEDICCFRTEDEARIRQVIPLSDRLLFVEFTIPMQRGGEPLRVVNNYTLTRLDTSNEVRIREIESQRFFVEEQTTALNPRWIEGDGDPRYIIVRTLVQDHWKRYELSVDNLLDYHGLPMAADGRTAQYNARKTKFDSGVDGINALNVGVEKNLTRQILLALFFEQDQIGGHFTEDDWVKE